jgi:hypothetical protein
MNLPADAAAPHHVWVEAESLGPLNGGNFSFQQPEATTKGSWALAGPGVAAEWTQGGESEFLSVAARADEPGEVVAGRDVEVPAAGTYTLWVRYADYRKRAETFGVRVTQAGAKAGDHRFGERPIIDELDPMSLMWDWSFAWDSRPVALQKGPARIEVYTTGPTEARRQIDCLCLTTDATYQPVGREKPDFAAWAPLRRIRDAAIKGPGVAEVEPFAKGKPGGEVHGAWKIADRPPTFVWNVSKTWFEELKRPDRVDVPFGVDPPLLEDFLKTFRGKDVPIYGHALSGATWHVPMYPEVFAAGSPFLDHLNRHPDKRFAILLNYGAPAWPAGTTPGQKQAVRANVKQLGDRFLGYVAGESIAHMAPDGAALDAKIRAAKSRADVLAALREAYTAMVVKGFTDYYGAPVTPEEAWRDVISCLSANAESHVHALCNWGVSRIGHENTGNSPTLARRVAFMRGAARQFGKKIADYQSANFGDSATMYSREAYFYGASSRWILDNSYDAWAGAGPSWLLRDYLVFGLGGCDVFYNEQGVDLFWKPGGNAAGDDFPVQLSPKGKVAQTAQRLLGENPRGTQYTPVAFLLDEAHGYSQERFQPGAFGIEPAKNPAVLTPGRHEAAIRGWFDVAYFPAPETQNEPATSLRQTYVNGVFGDIFDVLVTAPGKAQILPTYPVVIAAGEVAVSDEWGRALRAYADAGGTLVVAAGGQLSGPGAAALELPATGAEAEADAIVWAPSGETLASNVYRYAALPGQGGRVLATTPDGKPVVVAYPRGQGQLIAVGVPLGLGVDDRPVPVLAPLMQHLTAGLLPLKVGGDVEWIVNRLDDGGWLVTLLNNRGVDKPQHGVNPVDHRARQRVTVTFTGKVSKSREYLTGADVTWQAGDTGSTTQVVVPVGSVRMIALQPG